MWGGFGPHRDRRKQQRVGLIQSQQKLISVMGNRIWFHDSALEEQDDELKGVLRVHEQTAPEREPTSHTQLLSCGAGGQTPINARAHSAGSYVRPEGWVWVLR